MLFVSPDWGVAGATALVGALTIGCGALVQHVVASRNAARLEGIVLTRLDATDVRVDKIEQEQRDQWSKINTNTENVAEIRGKLSPKAMAAKC